MKNPVIFSNKTNLISEPCWNAFHFSPGLVWATRAIFALLFVLQICGNGAIIWILRVRLRTVSNVAHTFILSFAISDFISGLNAILCAYREDTGRVSFDLPTGKNANTWKLLRTMGSTHSIFSRSEYNSVIQYKVLNIIYLYVEQFTSMTTWILISCFAIIRNIFNNYYTVCLL